ncbi:hypothetical protein ABZ403_08920, partial [Micromonospora zamorensis]|uniref:hypothetical protein n=1 Tax=Micromonospora zamorensis TaxID=709883 RepID=UPI003408FE66
MAWISPRRTARVTSSSAVTPGKVLVMRRISRMVSSMVTVLCQVGRGTPQILNVLVSFALAFTMAVRSRSLRRTKVRALVAAIVRTVLS